jgi:hypothetical protein
MSGAGLTSDDVGKVICVHGAGAAGVALVTTISAVASATSATLADAAATTVDNAYVVWGTDNTAAFNAAFEAIRDAIADGTGLTNSTGLRRIAGDYKVTVHGQFLCLGSINATAIQSARKWGIEFSDGSVVYSLAAGKVAFDCYQSRFATLRNVHVFGDFQATPEVGLFVSHGLDSATGGCGEHLLEGCEINGAFTKAALYVYAVEEGVFLKSFFRNGYEGDDLATSYAAVFTGRNILGVESEHVETTYDTTQSYNGTLILNSEFCRTTANPANTSKGIGPAILLDDVKSFRAYAYVRQSGDEHAAVTIKSSGVLRNLYLNLIIEGVPSGSTDFPNYIFAPDDDTITMRDIEIVDHDVWGRSLIRFLDETRYVHGLKIRVPCVNKPLFETEYAGSTATLMPAIRGFEVIDTSALAATYTTPSINLDILRWLHGNINSQNDSMMVTTESTNRFSGVYNAASGLRIFQRSQDATVNASSAITIQGNLVRVSGAASSADNLARITKTNPLPGERITLHCLHAITLMHAGDPGVPDAGNIRMPTTADVTVPANYFVDLMWHAGSNVWRVVGMPT